MRVLTLLILSSVLALAILANISDKNIAEAEVPPFMEKISSQVIQTGFYRTIVHKWRDPQNGVVIYTIINADVPGIAVIRE